VGLDELNSGATKSCHQPDKLTACKHRMELTAGMSRKNLQLAKDNEAGGYGVGFSFGRENILI
jgi:hypothetical protein